MKKDFSAAQVAAALGVSKRTVYRAIHRSGTISPATSQRIWDYIHATYPELPAHPVCTETKVITVVTQRKPKFFWQTSLNAMQSVLEEYPEDAIRLRTVCFSGMRNEAELCGILSQISPLTTDALVLSPINTEKCRQMIREIAQQIPVVLMEDYFESEEAFLTVHSDGILEGVEAANLIALSALPKKNILLLHPFGHSCHYEDRILGFREQIGKIPSCSIVDELHLNSLCPGVDNIDTILPSIIARCLAKYFSTHPDNHINCLYIPDGFLEQICAAQLKLRRTDIYCFGHEINDTAQRLFDNGICGGYITTDIHFQSCTAMRLLADKLLYDQEPEKKHYSTPFRSVLIEN